MTGFYTSIMFIGIILIVVSLIWIAFDRKKSFDTELRIDEKKAELIRIIRDAEMMVEELNKFSDYVVTQIGEKNSEMTANFKEADGLIETMRIETSCFYESLKLQNEVAGNSYSVGVKHRVVDNSLSKKSDQVPVNFEETNVPVGKSLKSTSHTKVKDKVIPINSKHNEVISLAQKGLNETEIARKLNMGKGEIQLILGVNR
ncbi:DUF6115 domain-containing protein [Acetivibrio cellulolyticus]|uniref:DUF6115 domain-containing protein n=1 Tax=Acetivibrio cellulolyticus TaxID=35830 RepID=UPI0001E2BDDE|nr:hypothetical protein [Acetivibrio cellulolyticus]